MHMHNPLWGIINNEPAAADDGGCDGGVSLLQTLHTLHAGGTGGEKWCTCPCLTRPVRQYHWPSDRTSVMVVLPEIVTTNSLPMGTSAIYKGV